MKFSLSNVNLENNIASCIIVGVFESNQLSVTAEKLNKISNNYISNLLKLGDFEGNIGQILLLHNIPNISCQRILLVGCGKESELNHNKYKQILEKAIIKVKKTTSEEVIFCIQEINIKQLTLYWKIRQVIEITHNIFYNFNYFKSDKKTSNRFLRAIIFNSSNYDNNDVDNAKIAIEHGNAISFGIKVTKDLGNMPPNICNPSYLASQACNLAKDHYQNIKTNIIDKANMQKLGMNAYLAVSSGSQHEPLMSVIEYKGNLNCQLKPIVLVGKGLTFDSGGISIKPSEAMDEMKYDMCGAAAVYGIMCVLSKLNLPLYVIGILAACENMTDGLALRPGDILNTMSGKTVEVLNTDAEGRLVLCDVLTYTESFSPELVIDIATLTGACMIALGNNVSGLFSNNDKLAQELLKASNQSGDLAWQLPLYEEYQEQLNSNFADMTNIGSRAGGAITAACFLSRFTNKYNWAHLDIAGTAWCSNKNKGATGRPVSMISQFLLNRILNIK